MSRFKSGVVLRDGRVLHKDGVDSHTGILEAFSISDTRDDGHNIVPVECYPDDWVDLMKPAAYRLHVDCDITPSWFDEEMRDLAERRLQGAAAPASRRCLRT